MGKQIWKAGGNIRGNEAFMLWGRARQGSESPSVLSWIKERESWGARHFRDGQAFKSGSKSPNLSNVGGVVAQMKWGVVGTLGEQGMKDVILELTKKLEDKKIKPAGQPKIDLKTFYHLSHLIYFQIINLKLLKSNEKVICNIFYLNHNDCSINNIWKCN